MSRELKMTVGVLAERRKAVSRWVKEIWVPVGVTPSVSGFSAGDVVVSDDRMTRYFMGLAELTCYAAETEAYVHNFNSRNPALFVVLRRDADRSHPLPWYVHCVTASPFQVQEFEDVGEDIIERVAMPPEIAMAIDQFVAVFHKDETFKKRRRDRVDTEVQKFGKEPIFLNRGRPGGGRLDG
ncbi:DUF3305 domain-containing protein [Mesorhizobium xinjiangense]|uniref:DUF3305 domain-containing protein n=1 Tax=Mesorhizobium xinjiangense TaxID=2678685 RepID=UPI001F36DC1A|nr:DUF3305 domain-containing protein [Mesorhizobium xinjiangense]